MTEAFNWWKYWNLDYTRSRGFSPVERHFSPPDTTQVKILHHDTIEVAHFERFLQQCADEGTQVVLVTSPTHRSYWQCQVQDSALLYTLFDSIAHRHNLPWLDYTLDPISYDSTNFYNDFHLNAVGAGRFSRQLALDLDSLGLGIGRN